MRRKKRCCPYCGQEIDLDIEKCPFCDEILVKSEKKINYEEIKQKLTKILDLFNKVDSKYLKMSITCILAVLLILSVTNKYKIETFNGDIYRINQVTGDIKLISGKNIIDTEKVRNISKLERNRLSKFTTLKEHIIPGKDIICSLKIFWREGTLYYRFIASPYNDTLKQIMEGPYYDNYDKTFEILLKDKNGFTLLERSINVRNMIRVVNENNIPTSIEAEGTVNLSYEDMKLIKDWDIRWNL